MEQTSRENSIILSFSRLSSYKSCPYRCKNSVRQDSPEATAADLGTVCHECAAIFHRKGISEALKAFHEQAPNMGLSSEQTTDGLEIINRLGRNPFMQFPQERIVCVESDDGEIEDHGRKMFLVELPIVISGKKVLLRGAFDLVVTTPDGIEIIDHKSGFKKADKFQQELYALAAFLKYWRISPIRVRFHYMRSGFTEYEDFDESDLVGILQYVAILANAYANEAEWKPRFNSNCGDCEFRTSCPVYLDAISKLPDVPKIDPENWDAILKWSDHVASVERAAKKFGEELDEMKRAYLNKHGEARALDGRIAYIGERVNRYGLPWDLVKDTLSQFSTLDGLIDYLSTSSVQEFLEKKIVSGEMTTEQVAEITARFEKLKVPTSKSQTIKYKGDKPKNSKKTK